MRTLCGVGRQIDSDREALDHDVKRRLIGFLNACRVQGRENLTVSVDGGSVTLRGWFHSAHERQLCVENCRRMTGVAQVIDETKLAPANSLGSADSKSAYHSRPR